MNTITPWDWTRSTEMGEEADVPLVMTTQERSGLAVCMHQIRLCLTVSIQSESSANQGLVPMSNSPRPLNRTGINRCTQPWLVTEDCHLLAASAQQHGPGLFCNCTVALYSRALWMALSACPLGTELKPRRCRLRLDFLHLAVCPRVCAQYVCSPLDQRTEKESGSDSTAAAQLLTNSAGLLSPDR